MPGSPLRPLTQAVLRTQSDARLVTLAQRGNEFAFAEVVRRYRAPLVVFASAYAPSAQAEDVVQESLMRSWTAIRGSDREIALKPWLYTIVRNRALNARRDARVHEPLDDSLDGVRPPSEIVLEREELSRVVAAVAALPEQQREALVRSALDGRTHEQIATELGATPGSVRGMIHRGRVAVRGAAGALLPLPLVIALAGGAGAGGTAAAGGLAAGGTSLAGKAAAIAAVGAVAIGSGVVVERSLRDGNVDRGPARAQAQPSPDRADARDGRGEGRGAGDVGGPSRDGSGEDGGRRPGGGDDAREKAEREDESDGDDGEREHEGEREDDSDDRSGHGGSGSSHDDEGDEEEDSDSDEGSVSSGSGSSGSGSSGSGHSGSGGGDDGDDDEDERDDD